MIRQHHIRPAANGFLKQPFGGIVISNAFTSLGSCIQQLLQGWLAVAWGHSVLFLLVFGAARILPKVALTLPAGIICDRISRRRVLVTCRLLNCVASLLPLLGFLLPVPLAWLMAGIALGGALHAFDLPAGRALLGDLTPVEQLQPAVALNNAGSHLAALAGPPLAFLLGPFGLIAAAILYAGASAVGARLPEGVGSLVSPAEGGVDGLVRYARASPAVSGLALLSIAPGLVDKGVVLLVPSFASGAGTVSAALLAPEIGGLTAALLISLCRLRYGPASIAISAVFYLILVLASFQFSYEPEALIAGLALAGAAKLAFNTTSQTTLQASVPSGLRGRVFAF